MDQEEEKEHVSKPPLKHYDYKYIKSFVSGGCAGIAAKSLIAPFDRIKILFQTTTRSFTYKDGFKEAKELYNDQGVRSLWKGNLATIIRVFPYAATQFAAFDYFQAYFSSPNDSTFERNYHNFISGSLAGICATFVTYPTEFVRTRMGMEKDKNFNKTLSGTVKRVYKKEGAMAFYNGMIPSLLGIILYHGIGFFTYHYLKDELKKHRPEWSRSKTSDFVFAAIGGCFAQIIAYPFDVIRKKMQAQNILLERGEIPKTMRMLKWTEHVYQTEGLRGLYKGFTINFIKVPIANGTAFTIKNILNRAMDNRYQL